MLRAGPSLKCSFWLRQCPWNCFRTVKPRWPKFYRFVFQKSDAIFALIDRRLTLSPPVKIVPEMTYNVSSGTLSLYTRPLLLLSWKWYGRSECLPRTVSVIVTTGHFVYTTAMCQAYQLSTSLSPNTYQWLTTANKLLRRPRPPAGTTISLTSTKTGTSMATCCRWRHWSAGITRSLNFATVVPTRCSAVYVLLNNKPNNNSNNNNNDNSNLIGRSRPKVNGDWARS